MGVNKVILVGNLGKDPEMRYTSGQMAVASFSLATGERKKDSATGNWVDHTEWHNIVCFGKTAENCSQFLKKGSQAYIEGSIRTRKWQDKEGKDRYTTEIIANTVQFLGRREGGRAAGPGVDSMVEHVESNAGRDLLDSLPSAESLSGGGASQSGAAVSDDDIPF